MSDDLRAILHEAVADLRKDLHEAQTSNQIAFADVRERLVRVETLLSSHIVASNARLKNHDTRLDEHDTKLSEHVRLFGLVMGIGLTIVFVAEIVTAFMT